VRLIVVIAILGFARPSEACYPAFDHAFIEAPVFEPADGATITGESIDVECERNYTCTVVDTLDVTVTKATRVVVTGMHMLGTELSRDGEAARDTLELQPADTRFSVRARVELPEFIDACLTDGVIARHPYLSSAPAGNQRALQIESAVIPHVKWPAGWSHDVVSLPATRTAPASTISWFTVPGRLVTHGGPFALIGVASGPGHPLRVRGGWEAAIGRPWLVLGLAADTDFADSWSVALTAEPTTRAWVLPLSLGAGGGVVLASGGHVGGRGQLSVALGAVRVGGTLDMIAGGDLSIAGWIGGGL